MVLCTRCSSEDSFCGLVWKSRRKFVSRPARRIRRISVGCRGPPTLLKPIWSPAFTHVSFITHNSYDAKYMYCIRSQRVRVVIHLPSSSSPSGPAAITKITNARGHWYTYIYNKHIYVYMCAETVGDASEAVVDFQRTNNNDSRKNK